MSGRDDRRFLKALYLEIAAKVAAKMAKLRPTRPANPDRSD